ncbi:MAG: acyloxyacyl hydrolase [candidate division KSB1 bacterium]|nr:acyloxyacyl hydrolase [candidate division KSB1 bacterium]
MKLPFNVGQKWVQIAVAVVVALLVAALATRCAEAAEPVAQFSYGRTVLRGETDVLELAVRYPDAGPGDADYAFGVTFIGPSSLYDVPQPANFAWRAEIIDGFGRFDVGLGLAVMQNEDIYNSGRMNFTLSLGYRFKRWPVAVTLRHFSNGSTKRPNKGRDLLTIGWIFQ